MNRFPQQPVRRLSRVEAFAEQGVTLTYPPRSWSGVREDDGAIVIAIREGEVQGDSHGYRCLLWSPVLEGATEWVDRPIKSERLQHCRLAYRLGGAEGLLVAGAKAEVRRDSAVELRIEKRGEEYWAFWGLGVQSTALPGDVTLGARTDPESMRESMREPLRLAA